MAIDLENFPLSEAAKRMLTYVTAHWYDDSYVGKWVFEVMGREIDDVKAIIDSLPEQVKYQTATWALKYHEIKYSLQVQEDLPYERRRALIRQKMMENQSPMSPWRMEQILKAYTGEDTCAIHDCNDEGWEDYFSHPNIFKVEVDSNATVDISALKKRLDSIKQSHTTYELEFTSDVGILLTVGQTPWKMLFRICGTYPGVSTGLSLADPVINLAESDSVIGLTFIPAGVIEAGTEPDLSTELVLTDPGVLLAESDGAIALNFNHAGEHEAGVEPMLSKGLLSVDQGTALSATEEVYSVDVPYCGEEDN